MVTLDSKFKLLLMSRILVAVEKIVALCYNRDTQSYLIPSTTIRPCIGQTVLPAFLIYITIIGPLNTDSIYEKIWYDLHSISISLCRFAHPDDSYIRKTLGAVSIRKTVFPGMAIPMLKIRRPSGRLIFNMEITIRR